MYSILRDHTEQALSSVAFDMEVRNTIRELLIAARCSRQEVARALEMHPRTLVRRLSRSGTSYRMLLESTRGEVARQLLQDTRAPIARIAASLGYADPSVFTRAFRRWTDMTPLRYRRTVTSGAEPRAGMHVSKDQERKPAGRKKSRLA